MPTLRVTISDELFEQARSKLAAHHLTVEDHIVALLTELVDEAPPQVPLEPEMARQAEEGLRSPPIALDDSLWQGLAERAERFRRKTGT